MTHQEAVTWLREVEGELYRTRDGNGPRAWVAVVRTPGTSSRRGKLIIAMGDTLQSAAGAAAAQWQRVWRSLGRLH